MARSKVFDGKTASDWNVVVNKRKILRIKRQRAGMIGWFIEEVQVTRAVSSLPLTTRKPKPHLVYRFTGENSRKGSLLWLSNVFIRVFQSSILPL